MRKKIVCLDPGHGGKDPGAVSGSRLEKEDTLLLGELVAKELKKREVTVYFTRTLDCYRSLRERVELAEKVRADVFISLHRNAFSDSGAYGTELWVHPNTKEESTPLAAAVLSQLEQVGIQRNRGIKTGAYQMLTGSMPSVLVELGFITNTQDNHLFDTRLSPYARVISGGICEFLGVSGEEMLPSAPNPSDTLWRVQAGALL